jgi:hypothetical protein
MRSRAHAGGEPGGAADGVGKDPDAAFLSPQRQHAQDQPPREVYALIPDDKLALFVVPRVALLAGHVQGPGRLGELLRAGRRP